ncbi:MULTISPECIES: hypothetical protein [Acinetobacter]|uniref:DUF3139 domain-containing protein n=19 Tax=Acinetobacter baumannii TaxID=470 RepID=A0A0D5YJS4_ACIBA|nr:MULTISPECIES: hypothetical protein [Acinetobacter]EMT94718.1 hypothetical protein ABNIH6_14099 [Acinetobacter baumannii ABNIH6]AJF81093.1 hypothetical protein ABA1_01194 [Acinetobacter baumannii]AKA32512.1 hypothetical protein ABUW_2795 [Acinetobacter baumannii]ARG31086.1 hypothetical protein B7L41_07635 [Acinetobacter baumannii]ASF49770.1 hypothetical protein AB57_05350 [Acinetobacter baumannii AB0057]
MKFNMKKILIIIALLAPLMLITNYIANRLSKKNEIYIDQVLKQDLELHNKYGDITEYNLRKAGKSFSGGGDEQSYYYYTYSVKGNVTSGLIKLKLFENDQKKIDGYTIEFIK